MKILLLGSLISTEQMERLNNHSIEKASVAPVNYETMLAKGLRENGADIEAFSVAAVAAYPHSQYKLIRQFTECIEHTIHIHWIPFINVQLLKQITIKINVKRFIKRWLYENRYDRDKLILMYSIYPPYSKPATKLSKKSNCHLCSVIADLPEYMYTWKNSKGIKGMYAQILKQQMLELQGKSDSYILFTEKMAKKMEILNKPFMVSEGLCDLSIYDDIEIQNKYEKMTIVYAGNLSKLYGIRTLVDAFMLTKGDYELHLYGSGSDESYIERAAEKDKRIKYMGCVSRKEVLIALKKSHLIVINKPTSDDYSNYSFSSKILECMASGTPVLTTKVGGMPEEYYNYFYFIEKETKEDIARVLDKTIMDPYLEEKGKKARIFAKNKKNYLSMCREIIAFLQKMVGKEEV